MAVGRGWGDMDFSTSESQATSGWGRVDNITHS